MLIAETIQNSTNLNGNIPLLSFKLNKLMQWKSLPKIVAFP